MLWTAGEEQGADEHEGSEGVSGCVLNPAASATYSLDDPGQAM